MMNARLKRLIALFTALLMLFVIAGCGNSTDSAPESSLDSSESADEPSSLPDEEPASDRFVVDFRFTEPDGFTANANNPMLLHAPDPADSSFIVVSVADRDESLLQETKESYQQHLTAFYSDLFGKPAQVTINSFDFTDIDGTDGLRTTFSVDTGDFLASVLEITAVADQTFQVTFADATSDNSWADAFNTSADTFDVVWDNEVELPE